MHICACVTETLLIDRFLVKAVCKCTRAPGQGFLGNSVSLGILAPLCRCSVADFQHFDCSQGHLMSFRATQPLLQRLVQHTDHGMQLLDLLV